MDVPEMQCDVQLSIGEGQTEGKAVSSPLISTDRLMPQHPLGSLCCVFTAVLQGGTGK